MKFWSPKLPLPKSSTKSRLPQSNLVTVQNSCDLALMEETWYRYKLDPKPVRSVGMWANSLIELAAASINNLTE